MRLRRYLDRLHALLSTRRGCAIEVLQVDEVILGQAVTIEGRLRFWDGSLLQFYEAIYVQGVVLVKARYAYQYQDDQDCLVFRYDDAPHHPGVVTFPHHKHVVDANTGMERIVAANAPHLNDVLGEIERLFDSR